MAFLQNHDQIGNRALANGCRTSSRPSVSRSPAPALLLAPQIPMLYMGEEWSASTPFLYFVDFLDDEALAPAVREGRRREFANFKSFAEQAGERDIPDPTVEETFLQSRLDWSDTPARPSGKVLADTRRLLALRQQEIVPVTKTAFREAAASESQPGLLDVTWRYEGGTLRFVANFGEREAQVKLGGSQQTIWRSDRVIDAEAETRLPSWTGLFRKGGVE